MINPELDQGGQDWLLREQEIFHEKMFLNQLLVDQLVQSGEFTDDIALKICADLEDACPYMGHEVLISGAALSPVIDEDGDVVDEAWGETETMGTYYSIGIVDHDDHKMILHTILANTLPIGAGRTVRGYVNVLHHFSNYANITLIDSIDDESTRGYYYFDRDVSLIKQQIGTVVSISEELMQLDEDDAFCDFSPEEKDDLVNTLVEDACKKSELGGITIIIETERAYTPTILGKDRPTVDVIDVSKAVIYGRIVTLDTLHRMDYDASISSSKYNGLCFVIEPHEEVRRGLGMNDSSSLYVPLIKQPLSLTLGCEV